MAGVSNKDPLNGAELLSAVPPASIVVSVAMVVFAILVTFMWVRPMMIVIATVMIFAITGYIYLVVPVVMDKINLSAAGVIFMAVLTPMLDMARRNTEIERWTIDIGTPHDYRFLVDQSRRGIVADINAAKKTWLPHAD